MAEYDHENVIPLPYTRVLERAIGWLNLQEVRGHVARVTERGGRVSAALAEDDLAQAHPARVHAVLSSRTPGHEPFFEIRLWRTAASRSVGCPLELIPEDLVDVSRHPDAVYNDLVASLDRGRFTE